MIKLGYSSKNGYLSSSSFYIGGYFGYQRVVGTFISPNICGHILAIALSVILYNDLSIVMKKKFLYIFAVLLGLLGTLSRSAILAFIISSLFIWLVKKIKGIHKKIKAKKFMLAMSACIVGIVMVISADGIMLNHLFSRMLKSSLSGVIKMTDSSALKHYEDLFVPLKTVLEHPLGLGFGSNGPMALILNSNANAVESSFYLMLYEVGFIGSVIYFAPYFIVVIDTIKTRQYKYFVPASISVICLFIYLLLPNVQTYEIAFYFYLFLGLYYNKSVKLIYLCKSRKQT